ncbi:hypothetical protein, partial [Duganella sp. SG902]|uniref:hypothetical protein n=1 Tax=Duganella sp. SG902 TaxID=2587016 RepID=UPI001C4025C2
PYFSAPRLKYRDTDDDDARWRNSHNCNLHSFETMSTKLFRTAVRAGGDPYGADGDAAYGFPPARE